MAVIEDEHHGVERAVARIADTDPSGRGEQLTSFDVNSQRFAITRNGWPAAVLLGADDYEAIQETTVGAGGTADG